MVDNENIATLGLEFESKQTVDEIEKISNAFQSVVDKKGSVEDALKALVPADVQESIKTFSKTIEDLNKHIYSFNFLKQTFGSPLDDTSRKNIEELANALASIKPVDDATRNNLKQVINALNGFKMEGGKVENLKSAFTAPNGLNDISAAKANAFATILNAFKSLKGIESNIGDTISGAGNAVNGLQKVNDDVVGSYASLAEALNKLNGITNIGEAVAGISRIAGMKPISQDDIKNLDDYITGISNLIQLIAEHPEINSVANGSVGGGASPAVAPDAAQVSQETAKTVGEALEPLKKLKPENANAVKQIIDAFASFEAISQDKTNSAKALSEAISKFKGISAATADGVKKLFETIKNNIPGDDTDASKLKEIAEAIYKFRVIKKSMVDAMNSLFTSLGNLPDIDAPKTQAISNLGDAFIKMKFIKKSYVENFKGFVDKIQGLKEIKQNVYQSIGFLASAMDGFRALRKTTVENVIKLLNELPNAKPIPPETLKSIKTLRDLIAAMNLNLANTPKKVTQTNNSLYTMRTFADATTIALNSLRSALAVTVFARSAHDFLALGEELAYIKSIAPTLETKKLQDELMNLSSEFGDAAKNAKALYYAYSAGIRGSEESFVHFTQVASKTSQVIRSELVPTIDAMTAAMNAYGLTAADANVVSNTFFKIVKYGKASGEQLANSFGQVSPTAKTLGVSLDELGAAIASITKIQPTRVAITGLNNMLSKIMKPTRESASAIAKLGVDLSYSAVHTKGFVNVLKEVHDALGGNLEAIRNIFPDIRGQRAAMHLLGAGWQDFLNQVNNFTNGKDEINEAFNELNDTIERQLVLIPTTIQRIREEMGRIVTQTLTLNGAIAPLIKNFNSMTEGTRKFVAGSTLLITVLASLKAAFLTYHTLQALNLRNQMFLEQFAKKRNKTHNATLLLFQKEFQRRFALLGLDETEIQNRITRIALDKQDLLLKQSNLEFMKVQALLTGDKNKVMALENELLITQNQLLKINTLEKEANAVATAKQVMTGNKFVQYSGIGQISRLLNATWKGLATSVASVAGKAFSVIAKGLGSLATTALAAIHTSLIAIVGFIGVDFVQSLIRAGDTSKMMTRDILESIFEAIHGFKKEREEMIQFQKEFRETQKEINASFRSLKEMVIDFDNMKFDFTKEINNTTISKLVDDLHNYEVGYLEFAEKREAANKKLAEAQKKYDTYYLRDTVVKRLNDARKNTKELTEEVRKYGRVTEAIASGNSLVPREKLEDSLKQIKERMKKLGAFSLSEAQFIIDHEKNNLISLKQRAKSALEAAQAEVTRVSNEFEELNGNIAATKAQIEELGRSAVNFYVSVKDAIDKQDVELMDTFQKVDYHQGRIVDAYQSLEESARFITDGFITELSPDDIEESKEALSDYMESFKFLIKHFDDAKKANEDLNEEMQKNMKDIELKRIKSDSKVLRYYENEFANLANQLADETLSAQADIANIKKLYGELNNAANKMLDLRKKMTDAEQKANQKTLELIASFDQYASTAQSAVDVNSADALTLMSRQWTMGMNELPVVKQDATNPYETKVLEDMASIIDMIRVFSSTGIVKSDEQKEALMKGYESLRDAFSKNEEEIREQTAKIVEQLVKDNKLADQVQAERENGKNWDDLKKDLGDIKKSLQDMGKSQIQVYNVSM